VIILDTDALSHIQQENYAGAIIQAQLDVSLDRDVWITEVTAYEMLRGSMDLIERQKKKRGDLISAFELFEGLVKFLEKWKDRILSYDAKAEQIYRVFSPRLRQELKEDARIAAIALTHNASVWTCNLRDYSRAPGLILFDAKTGLEFP
jgi:predicted nucleic acid-binding protein